MNGHDHTVLDIMSMLIHVVKGFSYSEYSCRSLPSDGYSHLLIRLLTLLHFNLFHSSGYPIVTKGTVATRECQIILQPTGEN